MVPPERFHNSGGFKVVTVETEGIGSHETGVTTKVTRTAVPESAPDLYFRLTQAPGSIVDTRHLTQGPGLLLNSNPTQRRVGSPASPIGFTFGGEIVANPG